MNEQSSRRRFLIAGLSLPAFGNVSSSSRQPAAAGSAPAASGLRYRNLGKTGLKVTSVGFGCMITSDPTVIERAADAGINYFDTARGYQGGNNERMVGAALKSKRKSVVVSSKSHASGKEEALRDLETSLRELGTDYLDIWHLHAKSRPEQLTEELMEAQRVAKQQGKIRFAGVSTHAGHAELIPAAVKTGHFDVILTSYNFSMDPLMEKLIADARQAGVGIVAMKVMAGGFRKVREADPLHPKLGREGAMLAMLKWVLKNSNVDTTIPSITDLDQLDENLRVMTEAFGAADQKLLAGHLERIRPLYCRMCGACEGACARGLPVSDIIRYVSYAEGYGQYQLGREGFLTIPAELRQASCASCVKCAVRCPNGVQVGERVARAHELFA